MDRQNEIGTGTRLLALGCAVCPFCIAARRWPNSRYARTLAALEKACPFCRAYRKVHGCHTGSETTGTDASEGAERG